MSIYVTIEDKEEESFSEVIEIKKVQRHFPVLTDSVCLRFISDNADTFFNKAQIAVLSEELLALKDKQIKPEEQAELDHIIRLCTKADKNPKDVYLKFYTESSREQ